MNWSIASNRKLFMTRAEMELMAFLKKELPEFHAPTDVAAWKRRIPALRRLALEKVYLYGYPAAVVKAFPRVVWGEVLRPDPSYVIRKLRYEIFPDYWIPALLYEPVGLRGKLPVVLNPNGHHAGGKACGYKQIRCANLARQGVIALNMEFIGMGELRTEVPHDKAAYLYLTGLAGVGLFYLALQKGLDVLLAHKQADRGRVAVTGLSGGGWQTIVISALDPRVTLSVPVAGYTGLRARLKAASDMGDIEQTPVDMATVLDYQDLTAMLVPRPALLILNESDDCCFATARAKPVIYDAVRPTYRAFGAEDRFATYSNRVPGTHNYDADNRTQFYRFLNKHFGTSLSETDIHRPEEILAESRLDVGLPANQATIVSISVKRGRALAGKHRAPATAADRLKLRARIAECLRLPRYTVKDDQVCQNGDFSQHLFSVGPWTVPAAVWNPPDATEVELRISDAGRAATTGCAPDMKRRLFGMDLFGTGENATSPRLQMTAEAAGARILGIRTAQLLAMADHVAKSTGIPRVHLVAEGTNSAFTALVAAALRPARFQSLKTVGQLRSLVHLIELAYTYDAALPLFCSGLLEVTDIPQLKAMLEDVVYEQAYLGLWPEKAGSTVPPARI